MSTNVKAKILELLIEIILDDLDFLKSNGFGVCSFFLSSLMNARFYDVRKNYVFLSARFYFIRKISVLDIIRKIRT